MNHTNSKASEDNQIWLGMVSGQRLPTNFSHMDVDALRQLFITSSISVDVWEAEIRYLMAIRQSDQLVDHSSIF